jgi:hypothetical protein
MDNLQCTPNNDVLQWIANNPWHVIMFTVVVIALMVAIYMNRKDVLLKSALYIVAKVEEEWGSDMGRIKFAEAYTYLKSKYPIITFFLPEVMLSNIIEDALVRLKEILATKESKAKAKAAQEEQTQAE